MRRGREVEFGEGGRSEEEERSAVVAEESWRFERCYGGCRSNAQYVIEDSISIRLNLSYRGPVSTDRVK